MKTSCTVFVTMALLAVAALSVPGVHADVSSNPHTSQPTYDEKASWAPIRGLRPIDSPKQDPLDDVKPNKPDKYYHHHDPMQGPKQTHRALHEPVDSLQRNLGQVPLATPAQITISNVTATPAPTNTNTPVVTPAATTTKVTPAPTKPKPKVTPAATKPTHPPIKPKPTPARTTSSSSRATKKPSNTPKATPAAAKPKTTHGKPNSKPTPSVTKPTASYPKPTPAKTTACSTTTISGAVQQKVPGGQTNPQQQQQQQQQRFPHDHKQDGKQAPRNDKPHH